MVHIIQDAKIAEEVAFANMVDGVPDAKITEEVEFANMVDDVRSSSEF